MLTSVLVPSHKLIVEDPEMVHGIGDAHKYAMDFTSQNPDQAKEITINTIDDITGQKLEASIIEGPWDNMIFDTALAPEEIQACGDSSFNLKFLKEQPDFAWLTDTQFLE